MKPNEKIKALDAISEMLAGFPSFSSSISQTTGEAYLRAVEEGSLSAIEAACSAYLKGQVGGASLEFPPSAAQLAKLVTVLDDAAMSLSSSRGGLVAYRIGEQPPAGTVPLGATDIRGRKLIGGKASSG